MSDTAGPNLPSRDFDATVTFYAALGFSATFRDPGEWLILERGGLMLEFFQHRNPDPESSLFGACLRLDDLDGFVAACRAAGVPESDAGCPRLRAPRQTTWGGTMGALIDPDGSFLRLIANALPGSAGG